MGAPWLFRVGSENRPLEKGAQRPFLRFCACTHCDKHHLGAKPGFDEWRFVLFSKAAGASPRPTAQTRGSTSGISAARTISTDIQHRFY
ncbi:MAG: hypothetical protein IKB95_04375 [Bacteroidales bacterium]|nr:hypothetical protein [Bacteroidales bacterium]